MPIDIAKLRTESASGKAKALRSLTTSEESLKGFISSGGMSLLSEWLGESEVGVLLAVLGVLERIEMNVEILKETKIGKSLNENLKSWENSTAIQKGKSLLLQWKALVSKPQPPSASHPHPHPNQPATATTAARPAAGASTHTHMLGSSPRSLKSDSSKSEQPVIAQRSSFQISASSENSEDRSGLVVAAKSAPPSKPSATRSAQPSTKPTSTATKTNTNTTSTTTTIIDTSDSVSSQQSPKSLSTRAEPFNEKPSTDHVMLPIIREDEEEDFDPFSALASLAEEAPAIIRKSRRIRWAEDAELAHVLEFETDGAPMDVSLAQEHLLTTNHSEGQVRKFLETRRKERQSGGKGLGGTREGRTADFEDEVDVHRSWSVVRKLQIPDDCMYYIKNLKSYEKQDLADIHGGRPEVFFPDAIPSSPLEPSTAHYQTPVKTLDIVMRGLTHEEESAGEKSGEKSGERSSEKVGESSSKRESNDEEMTRQATQLFTELFVKLDSNIQRAVMDSEGLLKFFRKNPELMRDLTPDRVASIAAAFHKKDDDVVVHEVVHHPHTQHPHTQYQQVHQQGQQQQQHPQSHNMQDKSGWGVASIVSSIKNQAMSNLANHTHIPSNFQQQPPQQGVMPGFARPTQMISQQAHHPQQHFNGPRYQQVHPQVQYQLQHQQQHQQHQQHQQQPFGQPHGPVRHIHGAPPAQPYGGPQQPKDYHHPQPYRGPPRQY